MAFTEFHDRELELDYPCPWTYTVIGSDEARMREVIGHVVGGIEHTVESSHRSRTGKYCSLHLVATVESDSQRLGIFQELWSHDDIRYVL